MRSGWCLGCRIVTWEPHPMRNYWYLTSLPAFPATWLYHTMVTGCHKISSAWWEAPIMDCSSRFTIDCGAFDEGWIRRNGFMSSRWIQHAQHPLDKRGQAQPILRDEEPRIEWDDEHGWEAQMYLLKLLFPKKKTGGEDRRGSGYRGFAFYPLFDRPFRSG